MVNYPCLNATFLNPSRRILKIVSAGPVTISYSTSFLMQLTKGLLKIFRTYSSLLVGQSTKNIYFQDESTTAQFLNKIITTVACLFDAAGQHHMKPLCYFSAINSNVPIHDTALDCKPDIVLLCLVNGDYTRADHINWKDVQALIEHTTSKELPKRMALTITIKITRCSVLSLRGILSSIYVSLILVSMSQFLTMLARSIQTWYLLISLPPSSYSFEW